MKIPIVDENDKFLYYKDSAEYDLDKEITRGSSLWLSNEKGEILVAKRSKNKKHFPNIWGASAEGTVEENESYESNMIKETKEELGIDLDKIILGPKKRELDSQDYFAQYFFYQVPSDTKFTLQKSEVGEVRWVSLEKLKDWYFKNPEKFLPAFASSLEVIENYEKIIKK